MPNEAKKKVRKKQHENPSRTGFLFFFIFWLFVSWIWKEMKKEKKSNEIKKRRMEVKTLLMPKHKRNKIDTEGNKKYAT